MKLLLFASCLITYILQSGLSYAEDPKKAPNREQIQQLNRERDALMSDMKRISASVDRIDQEIEREYQEAKARQERGSTYEPYIIEEKKKRVKDLHSEREKLVAESKEVKVKINVLVEKYKTLKAQEEEQARAVKAKPVGEEPKDALYHWYSIGPRVYLFNPTIPGDQDRALEEALNGMEAYKGQNVYYPRLGKGSAAPAK